MVVNHCYNFVADSFCLALSSLMWFAPTHTALGETTPWNDYNAAQGQFRSTIVVTVESWYATTDGRTNRFLANTALSYRPTLRGLYKTSEIGCLF